MDDGGTFLREHYPAGAVGFVATFYVKEELQMTSRKKEVPSRALGIGG